MATMTVCIVAYHDYDCIKQAVDSLFEYTPSSVSVKVFIVDNSADISDDVKNKFRAELEKYPDVVYCDTHANLGFGRGHNFIMDQLDSDYHCIMNPDIIFCEDAFSKIIKYMERKPEVGMVIPNMTDEQGKRQAVYRKELTVADMFIRMFCRKLFPKRVADHILQHMDYSKSFQVPFGQGSFLVIRTELFKQLGGFDDNFFMYLEDADLCKRVNQKSKLMYLPDATVIHKWKQESHKNMKLFKIHVASMRYYFKKWGFKLW